jgi:hypothetical protein
MAQIELRNTTIYLKDGFTGTAAVNGPGAPAAPANGNTSLYIDTLADLPDAGTIVPVGVRFSVVGSTQPFYTVTATDANENQKVVVDATSGNFTLTFDGQTTANILYNASANDVLSALEALSNIAPGDVVVTSPVASSWIIKFTGVYAGVNVPVLIGADVDLMGGGDAITVTTLNAGGTTGIITFTPALATADGIPVDNAVITLLPARIEIRIGEGNITWTEAREFDYVLDRGNLDTVRQGDEQPLEVQIDFLYEFYTNGSGGEWNPSPIDFIKRTGEASNLESSSDDPCEVFAVDIEVVYDPPCGSELNEDYIFPDFRYESLEFNLQDATISVSGRCNATEPTVSRTS